MELKPCPFCGSEAEHIKLFASKRYDCFFGVKNAVMKPRRTQVSKMRKKRGTGGAKMGKGACGAKGHSVVLRIVYCEDCKNRAKGQDRDYTVYCERFRQMMDKTDFCSYGERETDSHADKSAQNDEGKE